MADFGQVTGAKRSRSEKFKKRLIDIIESTGKRSIVGPQGAADAVIGAIARFLDAFGSKTVVLNRQSKKRLAEMNDVERVKLRTRAIEELQAQTKAELSDVLDRFARGRIDEAEMRREGRDVLRRGALAAAVVGAGGVGNLTENALTAVQRMLSRQFNLLDGFINDMAPREITNRDAARMKQYAGFLHAVSEQVKRQVAIDSLGEREGREKRNLGAAEHCDDCIELASLGWVPIGTLPPIGSETACGDNCHCTIETRPVSEVEEQSEPVLEG